MSTRAHILGDWQYAGIPWKVGGRDRAGVDCAGLAALWLAENLALKIDVPPAARDDGLDLAQIVSRTQGDPHEVSRGDVVFFRHVPTGKIRHVAIALGDNLFLHTVQGCTSRIDRGLTLLARCNFVPAGFLSPRDAAALSAALKNPELGTVFQIVLLVLAVALSAASAFLGPKLPRFANQTGRYSGFNALYTQTTTEIPLPDVLGQVVLAGNAVHTTLIDKTLTVTDATAQKINRVIVFAGGPSEAILEVKVNGLDYTNDFFGLDAPYFGIQAEPTQNKAQCVDGTFGAVATKFSSYSTYLATHDITVPVDIRAQYDRNFPVYGFSGSSYVVFRFIDATKFTSGLNVTCRVKCRQCRSFDATGFITTAASAESLSGADGSKVRFKLAHWDIKFVTSLTVNGTPYAEISAAAQTGNVYQLNKTKGFVEFLTAPAAAATITITYDYYPRTWTANPVTQAIYLLTENVRGKGFDASKISWADAVTARDYCDTTVGWQSGSTGLVVGPRYTGNYAVDVRKPLTEHLRAILDAFYGYLFLSAGQFHLKPRAPASSVFSFNTANILVDSNGKSTFTSELIDRAQKLNRANVFYHSQAAYNAETAASRNDQQNQRDRAARVGNSGIVEQNLKYPAVDTESQAERLGETLVREEVNVHWLCEFKTSIKGLALEPGDIIDVTHSSQPAWSAKLFRIEELSQDGDDYHQLRCSEYFSGAYI